MVVGLLDNETFHSNRFTLLVPKSENDVRVGATLGSENPTGLPVGAVSVVANQGLIKNPDLIYVGWNLQIPIKEEKTDNNVVSK